MKILYVTTVGSTMGFFEEHFKMLLAKGDEIDLAYGLEKPLSKKIKEFGFKEHIISFSRRPVSVNNLKAYIQICKLIKTEKYDIVHCHTPNASVITRLVCQKYRKKDNLRVFYTAHGFHFFKGAPLLNWLVFYPVEWLCSFFTDTLITINKEDYELAKKHMHAKRVEYVPGVGIDVDKFKNTVVNKSEKRKELDIPEDAFLLVSVGELNKNKNHEVVIRAIAQIDNDKIHYAIAGVGELKDYLLNLAKELKIDDRVHLLGFRKDVAEIYKAGDVYIHPSFREGLPVSVMEAMASGLPVIAADNRGCRDLCKKNKRYFFKPNDNLMCSKKIIDLFSNKTNYVFLNEMWFGIDEILKRMRVLYGE